MTFSIVCQGDFGAIKHFLFCPTGFRIPSYIINIYTKFPKLTFLISIPIPLLLYPFPPLPHLFHPSYLPSVFIPYVFPFLSLPLSYFASIPHVLDCLSLFIAHSAPSFLSFHPTPVFSFLVPTSKSRHHFSFFCTLSPQVLWNFLCHTPLILPVVSEFFDSFPSFLLACVFVPFTQLYIHPASFCSQSFHFFTGIPVPLIVLFLSLFFSALFFFSIHFVLKLCRSLFSFHSKPIPLACFPDYVTWCFSAHS
jgi:hypothetical protein